jgi:hypothetical protein
LVISSHMYTQNREHMVGPSSMARMIGENW